MKINRFYFHPSQGMSEHILFQRPTVITLKMSLYQFDWTSKTIYHTLRWLDHRNLFPHEATSPRPKCQGSVSSVLSARLANGWLLPPLLRADPLCVGSMGILCDQNASSSKVTHPNSPCPQIQSHSEALGTRASTQNFGETCCSS